jgi:hypothetical protein
MSGRVVNLFSMRQFDFSNVGDDDTLELPIVKALDVSQYTEGKIVVRIHNHSVPSGGSIDIKAYITAPSVEDPSVEFTATSAIGSASVVYGSANPGLVTGNITSNFGGMLKITVLGDQPATATTMTATLSADLVLKD